VSRDARPEDGPQDGALTDDAGNVDENAVKTAAFSVIDRWERDRSLDAVRSRVGRVAGVSLAVAVFGAFVDVDGLAGLLLEFWWLASLPIATVAGAVYATLRDPHAARDIWWSEGALVTVGLVAIAALARAGTRNPYGRVAWQFLFDDDSPTGLDYGYDLAADVDAIDADRVRELRSYLQYAIWGSVVVAAGDVALRLYDGDGTGDVVALLESLLGSTTGGGGGGAPSMPAIVPSTTLEWALAVALALVVGAIVGVFVAVRRDL
jgi:hypothetical protein